MRVTDRELINIAAALPSRPQARSLCDSTYNVMMRGFGIYARNG
jgi:hypothetical protein